MLLLRKYTVSLLPELQGSTEIFCCMSAAGLCINARGALLPLTCVIFL